VVDISAGLVPVLTNAGVTSSTAELNILDGVTSTTAELNILDGVTSSTAELNILDGVTSTAAELNILDGVTSTTAELNFVDGVTSAIQTQLDAKAPIASPTFTGDVTIPDKIVHDGDTNTAIRFPAADTVTVETSGSERMRIDSSGNVGIGTSSPAHRLHVFDSTAGSSTESIGLQLQRTGTLGGQKSSSIFFDVGNGGGQAKIYTERLAAFGANLIFAPANSAGSFPERMRIDSSGNISMGPSVPTVELDVNRASGDTAVLVNTGSVANQEQARFTVQVTSPLRTATLGVYKHSGITNPAAYISMLEEEGTTQYLWVGNDGNFRISTTVSNIGTNSGTVVGAQTSDERLKDIEGPVPYGLNEVLALEPIRYTLKDDADKKLRLGFSAQKTLEIMPEVVFDTGEDMGDGEPTRLGMEYALMIPSLVNAIKQQEEVIQDLRRRLAALEA
jgi:hypothetical protein